MSRSPAAVFQRRPWARSLATSLLVLATALVATSGACTLGNADPEPVATAPADETGGFIAIRSGPLAGFRVFVPSGAVTEPIELAVFLDTITVTEAFRPLSGVARVEPAGLEFHGAIQPQVVLPLIDELVPTNANASEIRVLLRRPGGDLIPLVPEDVDFQQREVRVRAPAFGAFWAAFVVADNQLPLERYLPLDDGNSWVFESGVEARVTTRSDVPNLGGVELQELRIDFGPNLDLAFYLRWNGGGLWEYGLGSESVDRQDIRDAPYRWLPSLGGVGALVPSATSYRIFSPFGGSTVTDVGNLASAVELVTTAEVNTPIGAFPDALRVQVEQSWTPQSGPQELLLLDLWLVEGVGPVQVRLGGPGGLTPVRLLGATTLSSGN